MARSFYSTFQTSMRTIKYPFPLVHQHAIPEPLKLCILWKYSMHINATLVFKIRIRRKAVSGSSSGRKWVWFPDNFIFVVYLYMRKRAW